jgi:hypothetical protein
LTDALTMISLGLILAAQTATLWCSIRNRISILHQTRQQAEIELDGAIDRELLTGKRDATIGAIRDHVRNLLSRESEALLHSAHGDGYETHIGTRIDGRRR